jgi:Tol biopolymer transport system component
MSVNRGLDFIPRWGKLEMDGAAESGQPATLGDLKGLRLESWGEIAAHLKRDVRTVQRWERDEGLPVHRHQHKDRGTVYAFTGEIDRWSAQRSFGPDHRPRAPTAHPQPEPEPESSQPPWWKRRETIALAACIAVAGLLYPWIAPEIERLWRLHELQQLKVVPLTALPGNVWSPTFSPDGNQIAFAWHDDTYAPGANLYAMVIGTAEPVQLTHDPAGRVVGAAWSPDGRTIALCRGPESHDQAVYLMSALGGPLRKLTSTTCRNWSGNGFAWSPDGKQLVFHHQYANSPSEWTVRLFVLSLDSMTETPVKSDCNDMTAPAFSPRGDYLAWVCAQRMGDYAIYVQRMSDGSAIQLVHGLGGIGGLAWSADGRRIVFSSPGFDTGGDLWEVALAHPNQPQRLPFSHDAMNPVVSFTGHRLAFKQVHINVNIWRVDLTEPQAPAQKVVVSSRKQYSPNYSPDGKQIAFDSNRSGNNETWVCDADGSNAVQLSSFGIYSTGTPRWSPDGKVIAFDSRVEGEANIYLINPHGGVPRKLDIDIGGNSMPSWSHDGAWIYFQNGDDAGNSSVWKVPSKGGHAVQISKDDTGDPQESPDGQYVYFQRNWWLWRVRTDGTDEQQVEGMPRLPLPWTEAWTPFGGGIYFLGFANGKSAINFFDLRTKELRPVYFLEKPAPFWVGGLPISSDGHWLLLPLVEEASSDLMLVENWR